MASILKTDKIEGVTASGTVQMPAGVCIQTTEFTNNVKVDSNSSSYVHTGVTVNITPKFNDSKIYINAFMHYYIIGNHDHGISFKITRTLSGTETDIYTPTNTYEAYFYDGVANSQSHQHMDRLPIFAVDTPNTLSQCSYKIYYRSMRTDAGNGIAVQGDNNKSHGFLQEIAQ